MDFFADRATRPEPRRPPPSVAPAEVHARRQRSRPRRLNDWRTSLFRGIKPKADDDDFVSLTFVSLTGQSPETPRDSSLPTLNERSAGKPEEIEGRTLSSGCTSQEKMKGARMPPSCPGKEGNRRRLPAAVRSPVSRPTSLLPQRRTCLARAAVRGSSRGDPGKALSRTC
jgi:hypothetical protein